MNPKSLAEHLKTLIISKGPLTIAEFMKLSLTHPTLGFYHNCDVIGKEQSHFITSPRSTRFLESFWVFGV